MTTRITRPYKDRRTPAEKQEAALLAAFRRMGPRERFRLLRAATMPRRHGILVAHSGYISKSDVDGAAQ
jgi:hypothetical protein